jgi:4-hydroxyphenylpyruvate dioxygenase
MKIDYIHFYVEDAKASLDWFVNYMGFQPLASGESCHTRTTVVKSGAVYIVLSSPLTQASPVAQYLRLHPPGVADIAFVVSDLEGVMERAVTNGAKVLQPVEQYQLSQGAWKWGKIAAWGSLSHTLSDSALGDRISSVSLLPVLSDLDQEGARDWGVGTRELGNDQRGMPHDEQNYSSWGIHHSSLQTSPQPLVPSPFKSGLFSEIDHVVLNVATGDLERALRWYEDVLGFQRQQTFTIQTDKSGLRSQVLVHPKSGVQFPINEPASANSQIQEFLDINQGSGIQHIALQTPQIVQAIARLRHLGLSFLPIPSSYYTQLRLNHPGLPLSVAELEEIAAQQILVDWQEESTQALLLQTFTQPIFEKPTFFFELIERRQEARGFGEGNFRALFEAIEREQLKRGSLGIN